MTVRIAALVPVGSLEAAKSRLGGALDAEERQDLADRMLARTLNAALAVDSLADVLVVSPDREVLRRAADLGARTLRQRTVGLNPGLTEARADVVAGGADALIVLPIDLAFVSAEALAAVVAPLLGAGTRPVVALVADRHRTGTNALGLRPTGIIDFAFGPGSRDAHRAAAELAGARYVEMQGPLAVDIDTPTDLVFVENASAETVRVN